ncbi:DNA-binding response regulator, partial [Mesorhizobium sp. M7A.F.Ca.CA.004.05.1.1]
ISESTVKLHRGSVMRKLNVRTVPDLVRMADIMAQSIEPRQSQQL